MGNLKEHFPILLKFDPNSRIWKVFKVITSISLLIFLLYKIEITRVASIVKKDILIYLFSALLLLLLTLLIMSTRWQKIILTFHLPPFKIKTLFKFYLIGAFFNNLLPGAIGGDIMRTRAFIKTSGTKVSKATQITIIERIFGLGSLLIILSLSVFLLDIPKEFYSKFQTLWQWAIITGSIAFLLLLILRNKIFKTITISSASIIIILFLSILSQMGDIIIAYVFSHYFNLQIPFTQFFFIMPLVYLATVLPISLGGLGVREGVMAGLLSLYGIEISLAIGISFLMTIIKLLIGIIGWFTYIRMK